MKKEKLIRAAAIGMQWIVTESALCGLAVLLLESYKRLKPIAL